MATKVQFVNNRMQIKNNASGPWTNWENFYPIGWYSPSNLKSPCPGGTPDCFDDITATRQALTDIKNAGGNTVLEYWNGVIGRYSSLITGYDVDDPATYSKENYALVLETFLDDCEARGLKAIVHLPISPVWSGAIALPNSYLEYIVGEFKNHNALLGWYQADEPEIVDEYPAATYELLRERYNLIKTEDPFHPVFVVFVSEARFRVRYTTIGEPIDGYNVEPLEEEDYTGPIYDVLMMDSYVVMDETEPLPPQVQGYPELRDIRHPSYMQRVIYNNQISSSSHGMIMFVSQGYGRFDLLGDELWEDGDPNTAMPLGTPSLDDILFAVLTNAKHNQDKSDPGDLTLVQGGLLFWSHRYADQDNRDNVNEFITFFTSVHTELDRVITSDESISGITAQFIDPDISFGWGFTHFIKKYDGKVYLFVIPDKEDNPDPIKTVTFDELHVNGLGTAQYCHELVIEGGDAYYRKWVNLTSLGSGNFAFTDEEDREFTTYKARIFRITL